MELRALAMDSITSVVYRCTNIHDRCNDVAADSQFGGGIATKAEAQVMGKYEDINQQLAEMMMKEKREAYDAGALGLMDCVIQLCEASGGRLNTRQLRDYKAYVTRSLERENSEKETEVQQQANAAPVQSVPRRPDPEVVVIARDEPPFGSDVPVEATQSQAGQASEAVTQAEQG